MAKTRVLVVDDSLTVRKRLAEVLLEHGLEVVGEASDGMRAIELCRDLRPDVVTLDMALPVLGGLAATEYIMAYFPTPILIVSAQTNRGGLYKTYDALAAGAVDVLEKPEGDEPEQSWERAFVAAVKMVARIKVITHPRARLGAMGRAPLPKPPVVEPPPPHASARLRAIALGASTGGPGALLEVLRAIPPRQSLAILVVLHLDEPFGNAFVEWLDEQTPHRVVNAREGLSLAATHGTVVVAAAGQHLMVREGRLRLTRDPPMHSCRPSIDVLFSSLALECGAQTAAALLTGMGRDGAAGLLALREAGAFTIAQDEATSVVYGMPREAALLGAAERVLPLAAIGPALAQIVEKKLGSEP